MLSLEKVVFSLWLKLINVEDHENATEKRQSPCPFSNNYFSGGGQNSESLENHERVTYIITVVNNNQQIFSHGERIQLILTLGPS